MESAPTVVISWIGGDECLDVNLPLFSIAVHPDLGCGQSPP